MPQRNTVVGEIEPLSKQQLHAKVMLGWSRAIANLGKGAFADKLDITVPGLDKQLAGSMPGFDLIDKALDLEPSLLEDWLSHKKKRLVDIDAICSTDDIGLVMARLLAWFHEASHPNSPGGVAIVHSEKLAAEPLMRQLHCEIGKFLEEIAGMRRPRAVA